MRRSYLSFLLIVTLLFSCLSLSGCGKVHREYRAFYNSLVNKDGNFRFRGMEPGTSQKDIIQMEGIDGIEGEDITSKDSTGLFRCLVPVQFPCFSFDLYRDYKTATHIPSRDGGRLDGFLTSGGYLAFFEQEEDFTAACGQITAFLKEYFPRETSFEALDQIPKPEQRLLSPQWQTEAEDGSRLLVTFQNRVSPINPNRAPAFCSIRIEVSYQNLAESSTEDYQEFYQALSNREGNFRFRGTEPGQTYEELIASFEKEGYGKEVLTPFDLFVSCTVPDSFPCFDFSLYKRYHMDQSSNSINGKTDWTTKDSLTGGSYLSSFYREEDWIAACRQIIAFLKAKFPGGVSFEELEHTPEPEKLMSPQWEIEGADGSKISVTFQNKDMDHPLNKAPSTCSIALTVSYSNVR